MAIKNNPTKTTITFFCLKKVMLNYFALFSCGCQSGLNRKPLGCSGVKVTLMEKSSHWSVQKEHNTEKLNHIQAVQEYLHYCVSEDPKLSSNCLYFLAIGQLYLGPCCFSQISLMEGKTFEVFKGKPGRSIQ